MGVNSLPKTVTRHRRDCDLNPDRATHVASPNMQLFELRTWDRQTDTQTDGRIAALLDALCCVIVDLKSQHAHSRLLQFSVRLGLQ